MDGWCFGPGLSSGLTPHTETLPSSQRVSKAKEPPSISMLFGAASRRTGVALLGAASLLTALSLPLQAQDRVPIEAVRAINLARTRAVEVNGGLQAYRPAQCMFSTAARQNPCMVSSDRDGFVFLFMGGPPSWEQDNETPTVETQIQISRDGRTVEEVIYNGPPR